MLSLSLPLAPLGGVKEGTGLLHLTLQGVGATLCQAGPLGHLLAEAGSLLMLDLSLPQLALVALDGLEGLVVGLVGVVKGNLKLVDVTLKLLLDAESLSLGLLLGLQRGLHRLHGVGVVLASVVELLLRNLAIDLLPDLAELQGGPQHLVLLRLEGALSLLKSRLQLLLLGLHAPPLFVQLMDGTSTVSQLVKQILDLIGKVLVLAADNVQLLIGLIQARLEAEPLIAVVASLRVTGIKLGHRVISLGLPFSNNLVKVLTALLSNASSGVGTLVLHGKLLELRIHTRLGLLSRSNLRIERLNQLLSLSDPSAKLGLAALKLINATKSLSLVLGLPQLDLRLGLGEGLEDIILLLRLLINLHPQVLGLTAERFEFGEEGGTVAGLAISQPLGVLKLGRQRDLVLLQSTNGVLGLVNLAGQVLSLNLELLLGRVSIIESAGKLILLLVRLNNQALGHLAVLLHVGAVAHGLLESSPGLLEVPLHTGLVLLRLGAVVALNRQLLIKLINAGNKLLDLLGVLGSEGSLVLNLGSNGGNLLVLALHSLGEL